MIPLVKAEFERVKARRLFRVLLIASALLLAGGGVLAFVNTSSISEEANRREPEAMLCDFEVMMKNGRKDTVRVEYHRGHWRNPMSDAEIVEKFRGLASDVLTKSKTEALLGKLWKLEELRDVRALTAMTVP